MKHLHHSVPGALFLAGLAFLHRADLFTVLPTAALGLTALAVQTVLLRYQPGREEQKLAATLRQVRHDQKIDLTRTVTADDLRRAGLQGIAREIDNITELLNAIVIDVIATAKKFSLFSTDIYYSGQHLSELSHTQADLMRRLLDRAGEVEQDLGTLQESINRCLHRIEGTADQYQTLRRQAEKAQGELAPLGSIVDRAGTLAESGQSHMQRSLGSTADLQSEITRLNSHMTGMEQRTSEVGTVLSALQGLADTTHVLATNASIVAARAGNAGRGFAVIAGEVRSLAADSRSAISRVEDFLTVMTGEIRKSAAIASTGARMITDLTGYATLTSDSLREITGGVEELRAGMGSFRALFDQQQTLIRETLEQSEEVHRQVEDVGEGITRHAEEYGRMNALVDSAVKGAAGAAHSARVLSQLGTYLRTGGQELSHLVEQFEVSEQRLLAGITRKEPRTTLLYNLEVFQDGVLLGHLGDISPSGLLLLTPREFPLGEPVCAAIHLPLSSGEMPPIPICFIPRRQEQRKAYYRTGCSIEEQSSRKQREDIEMIITNFTVTHGMETFPVEAVATETDAVTEAETEAAEDIDELEELDDLE